MATRLKSNTVAELARVSAHVCVHEDAIVSAVEVRVGAGRWLRNRR
jgi:hypothetical protein